jgi:hypothetical protein
LAIYNTSAIVFAITAILTLPKAQHAPQQRLLNRQFQTNLSSPALKAQRLAPFQPSSPCVKWFVFPNDHYAVFASGLFMCLTGAGGWKGLALLFMPQATNIKPCQYQNFRNPLLAGEGKDVGL